MIQALLSSGACPNFHAFEEEIYGEWEEQSSNAEKHSHHISN